MRSSYTLAILILFFMSQAILCCPTRWFQDGTTSDGKEICYALKYTSDYYDWKKGDPLNLNKAKQRCESANPVLGCELFKQVSYCQKCADGYAHIDYKQYCEFVKCPSGYLFLKSTDLKNYFLINYCYKSS